MYDFSLGGLAYEIHQLNVDKGWYDPDQERTFGDLIALVHSELSEALEEYRNGHAPKEIYFPGHPDGPTPPSALAAWDWARQGAKPEGVPIELADALIRILDMCAALSIDIEGAVELKLRYNRTRPPRHGGKKL